MLVLFQDKGTFYWLTLLFYDRRHFLLALFFLDAYFPVFRRALFYFFHYDFLSRYRCNFLDQTHFQKGLLTLFTFQPNFFRRSHFLLKINLKPLTRKIKLKLMVTFLKIKTPHFKNQQTPDNRSPHPLNSLKNSLTNKYTNIYKLFKRLQSLFQELGFEVRFQ